MSRTLSPDICIIPHRYVFVKRFLKKICNFFSKEPRNAFLLDFALLPPICSSVGTIGFCPLISGFHSCPLDILIISHFRVFVKRFFEKNISFFIIQHLRIKKISFRRPAKSKRLYRFLTLYLFACVSRIGRGCCVPLLTIIVYHRPIGKSIVRCYKFGRFGGVKFV